MPRYSEQRKANLLTVDEAVVRTGKSAKTIRRRMSEPYVYVEYHQVKAKVGSVRTAYIDVRTLGFPLLPVTDGADGHDQAQESGWSLPLVTHSPADGHDSAPVLEQLERRLPVGLPQQSAGTHVLSIRTQDNGTLEPLSAAVVDLHQRLQPALRMKRNSPGRGELVKSLAGELNVSPRNVHRWLTALEQHGNNPYALVRQRRSDKGKLRLPEEKRELITAAFLNNKPGASANAVYRALKRAVPEELTYVNKQGHLKTIEVHTVRAVQKELMDDTAMQLIFKDTTERKEFMRVYNGRVRALHANAQWQIDMTRCDTEVFNPVTGEFYRLRVQHVIDVFSGCIVGLSFSRAEDTVQVKIALLRALKPKEGRFAHLYPLWGTPNVIYWDNGKTYTCRESERILSVLGIQSIHSTPRVSHTRGKVERSFGTLHKMLEATLPGYVGEDAVDRDSEELRQLRERTMRWQATGRDPGRQNRHLTEDEYKSIVLIWLLTEYHQMIQYTGLTRQEMYLASVQAEASHTLRRYDGDDLFRVFCKHTERVVTKDGGVLYQNRIFKSPSGALAGYAGRTVYLLEDSFSPEGWFGVVYPRRDGTYLSLGDVEPASEWADSAESAQTRQIEKAGRKALVDTYQEQRSRLFRPELNVGESLINALPPATPDALPYIDVEPTPLPTAHARLAISDKPADLGDFGKFLEAGTKAQTADEFMAAVKTSLPTRKK